jgi:hypothetical protein
MNSSPGKTSPLLLAAAWIVVVIPLAWGVYQTAKKSLPLFVGPTAAAPVQPGGGTGVEKPPGDRSRWTGERTEYNVESSTRSDR